ncbi:MAG: tyrosine-protein phosphatase, partial [Chloroflexi bacterium]|nr:tyrosine-protein phosphatase [Chloroflexota bacterium]
PTMQPRRHIALEGASQVRALGGYPTLDGRQTRWRTFLRSDGINRLTPRSQERLVQYGVRTVIDLRRTWEVQKAPNVFADSSLVTYHHQNLLGEDPASQSSVDAEAAGRLGTLYGLWLDQVQDQVGKTLATLASPSGSPAVFHCSAGKDRTGIISALLLSLAGVPEQTIAEDYALSASQLFDVYVNEFAPPDLRATYTVEDYESDHCPPEAMLETLAHLEDRYGGVEAYVRGCGLSATQVESLREALVE